MFQSPLYQTQVKTVTDQKGTVTVPVEFKFHVPVSTGQLSIGGINFAYSDNANHKFGAMKYWPYWQNTTVNSAKTEWTVHGNVQILLRDKHSDSQSYDATLTVVCMAFPVPYFFYNRP